MTMLADAKVMIGSAVASTTDFDAILNLLIPSVIAAADEYMGVAYTRVETETEDLFDGGVRTLFLSHVNVANVVVEQDDEVVEATEYDVDAVRGVVRLKSGVFSTGTCNISVTYQTAGYAEDNIPASLRMKLLKQITYEFRQRESPGLSAVSYPDGTIQKFDVGEWLKDVREELDRRRRIAL